MLGVAVQGRSECLNVVHRWLAPQTSNIWLVWRNRRLRSLLRGAERASIRTVSPAT